MNLEEINIFEPSNNQSVSKEPHNISYTNEVPKSANFSGTNNSLENVDLSGPVLVADAIEKPGNLGTMIRTARAFNFLNIISSDGVTDIYNPNVVRNTPPLISKLGCEYSPHNPIKCFKKCKKSFIKISVYYYQPFSLLYKSIKLLLKIQTYFILRPFKR